MSVMMMGRTKKNFRIIDIDFTTTGKPMKIKVFS